MAILTDFPSLPPIPMIISGNCRICDQSEIILLSRHNSESVQRAWFGERLHESGDGVPVKNIRAGATTPPPWTFAAAELMRPFHVTALKVFVA